MTFDDTTTTTDSNLSTLTLPPILGAKPQRSTICPTTSSKRPHIKLIAIKILDGNKGSQVLPPMVANTQNGT